VRELANVIQRLAVLARDIEVTVDDVAAILGQQDGWTATAAPDLAAQLAAQVEQWTLTAIGEGTGAPLHAALAAIVDAAQIQAVLDHTRGNQLAAARLLGINRNTLRKRLVELRLATQGDKL
jgi:two-component system, NtrC family, nitrogen regulation response regulator GlnG